MFNLYECAATLDRDGRESVKISVVTAVYNRKDTIRASIESVQSQLYRDVEHVIQDGGSIDGTLDIVREMATEATRVVSEPDDGLYAAINSGIERASGDVIGLMHSDDLFFGPHVLEKVARAFALDEIDGVYGDLQYVAADDPNRIIRYWRSGEFAPRLLRKGWMPPHPTLYLRRRVFDQFGLYDTSFRIAADYDAMLRYLHKGGINLAYIPEVLVKMRVGGESNRSIGRIFLKSREDLAALRRNNVGGVFTLMSKNVSKIGQFFSRDSDSK